MMKYSEIKKNILSFFLKEFIYYLVRFLSLSYRYQIIGGENITLAKSTSPYGTYSLAVWHQSMLSTFAYFSTTPHTLIISPSRDGDLMAKSAQRFGHFPIRGSSSRGGKEALQEIIKVMKSGVPAAMAVDGPKGPPRVVKAGVLQMAKLTQSSVLPFSCYASSFWNFRSWDEFRLPKPFSKIVIVFGKPISISNEALEEEFIQTLDHIKNQLNANELVAKDFIHKS